MQTTTLINGAPQDKLSVADRGLHYGDGLFETIAVVTGQPSYWQQHLARLILGCQRLKFPVIDIDQLTAEAKQILAEKKSGVLKIILTRGHGKRGYQPEKRPNLNHILLFYPNTEVMPAAQAESGVKLTICQTPIVKNPLLSGIKHLNRLEQVLASAEWSDKNIYDGLMLYQQEYAVCGTKTNLFIVKDGILITDPLIEYGINGVMRAEIIEQAKASAIPIELRPLTLDECLSADEVFISNSLIGIYPVTAIVKHTYAIGKITKTLQTLIASRQCLGF
ncbi:MAG: aminodeoxychorismate lyase [Pseudomonadota bacterium]